MYTLIASCESDCFLIIRLYDLVLNKPPKVISVFWYNSNHTLYNFNNSLSSDNTTTFVYFLIKLIVSFFMIQCYIHNGIYLIMLRGDSRAMIPNHPRSQHGALPIKLQPHLSTIFKIGAGNRNRICIICLEGSHNTIILYPHFSIFSCCYPTIRLFTFFISFSTVNTTFIITIPMCSILRIIFSFL